MTCSTPFSPVTYLFCLVNIHWLRLILSVQSCLIRFCSCDCVRCTTAWPAGPLLLPEHHHLHHHTGHHTSPQDNYKKCFVHNFYSSLKAWATGSWGLLGCCVSHTCRTLQACVLLTWHHQMNYFLFITVTSLHLHTNKIHVQGFDSFTKCYMKKKKMESIDQLQLDFAGWFELLEGSRTSASVCTWRRVTNSCALLKQCNSQPILKKHASHASYCLQQHFKLLQQ